MPRRVRKTPWSRTGCTTCKRRRKKCDGEKPKCQTCIRLGLECVQFDTFCPINVVTPSRDAKSKLAFRPERTRRSWPSPWSGANTSDGSEVTSSRFNETELDTSQLILKYSSPKNESILLSLSTFPAQPNHVFHLLQYYLERLTNVLVNADSLTNPLRSLILPRIASSTLLLDAVCATAAVHRSTSSSAAGREFATAATSYYVRVLSTVRDLISQISHPDIAGSKHDTTTIETVILASVFLCKYEIIKDGVENWRFHLRGIESMCTSLSPEQMAAMSDTITYVRSFMTYHKSIARITECGLPPSSDEDRLQLPTDSAQLSPVDPYMGFSQSLITLLRRVSGLATWDTAYADLAVLRKELQSILLSLSQSTWDPEQFAMPEGMTLSTVKHSQYIAEAYKSAVFACIHAVLDRIYEREAITDTSRQAEWALLHAMLPTDKACALTDCLEAVSLVPLGCPEEAGLLPLLFIVACETNRPDQTAEAIKRVEALGSNIGLGNVRYTSALLKQVLLRRTKWENWHDWRGLLAKAKWDLIIT